MIRLLRRTTFRAILRSLSVLLLHSPRWTLRAADAMAPLVFAPIPAARVTAVFPSLPPNVVRKVITTCRRHQMRDLVLAEAVRRYGPVEPFRKLVVADEHLANLPHPSVLGTFHLGSLAAIGFALAKLPANVLVLRGTPKFSDAHRNVTIEITRGDDQHRARVFYRAVQFLQAGEFVFVPLDPEESARVAAPFRGRELQLARGPFALSRITGAPMIPIIARWEGMRIAYVCGDPIPSSHDEAALARAAAAWLEEHLATHPLDITDRVLTLTN